MTVGVEAPWEPSSHLEVLMRPETPVKGLGLRDSGFRGSGLFSGVVGLKYFQGLIR